MLKRLLAKVKIKYVVIAGVIALAAIFAFKFFGQHAAPPLRVPEVAVVTVQLQSLELTTELTGRISSNLMSDVRPQVNGIILKRLFVEGTDVKAGQTLYQIDPAPYQEALASAQASAARAEANLVPARLKEERYRELVKVKAVSQQEYDDASAAYKLAVAELAAAKAAVETAKINLGYTRVTAPISGRIGKSFVTPGALVTAHQAAALATIQQFDPTYVDVTQSTADLMRLKKRLEEGILKQKSKDQNKVKLVLDDGTVYPLEGTLQFRDVTVDPTTASVILRMTFPNPKGVLLPGMFVRAYVKEGVDDKAILIPQQSVARDPKGNPYVLVVDASGKVEQRQLVLDRAIGDKWLVSQGLSAGERIVVEGMQKVRAGVTAKVIPFTEKAPTPDAEAAKPEQQAAPAPAK
jgi:membrane fusion protein (multidrug efflux system)